MPKLVVVCLCAAVAFVALVATPLLRPVHALAAAATLTAATPLQEAPAPDATVLTLVPEGSLVSVDGPPVEGFYPVTAGDLSGWMPGEALLIAKDEVVADDPYGNPAPDASGEVMPGDQPPPDPSPDIAPAAELPATDTAAAPASDAITPPEAANSAPIDSTALSSEPAAPTEGSPAAAGEPALVPEASDATP